MRLKVMTGTLLERLELLSAVDALSRLIRMGVLLAIPQRHGTTKGLSADIADKRCVSGRQIPPLMSLQLPRVGSAVGTLAIAAMKNEPGGFRATPSRALLQGCEPRICVCTQNRINASEMLHEFVWLWR